MRKCLTFAVMLLLSISAFSEEKLKDFGFKTNISCPAEIKMEYGGTALLTSCKTGTPVYEAPGTDSAIIGTVTGTNLFVVGMVNTNEKIEIERKNSKNKKPIIKNVYWACVSGSEYGPSVWNVGWVRTDNLVLGKNVSPSYTTYGENGFRLGRNNGKSSYGKVAISKNKDKSYFTWSYENDEFYYTDPVGLFVYTLADNSVKHVSTIGHSSESAWTKVSDDGKYVIQDFGTGPSPREFVIYDIKTNKKLFSGLYENRDFNVVKDEFTFIKRYDNYENSTDEGVKSFVKNNKIPDALIAKKMPIAVFADYSYNLVTKKTKLIKCSYATVQ